MATAMMFLYDLSEFSFTVDAHMYQEIFCNLGHC
jgi:hypothetical protein